MKRNRPMLAIRLAVVLLGFALPCPHGLRAQQNLEYWISVSDDAAPGDSLAMYFGNYSGATYGVDSITPTIKEVIGPPISAEFDVRWVHIPGRVNEYYAGLLRYNFYPPTNKPDTFALFISNIDHPDAVWKLRWQNAAVLSLQSDSMFLVELSGRIRRVDMFLQNNLTLVAPIDSGIQEFLIINYKNLLMCDYCPSGSDLWLTLDDGRCLSSRLFFGNYYDATYGLDTLGNSPREYVRVEPPPSPSGEAYWARVPGRSESRPDLFPSDFRGWENIYRLDTFAVAFYDSCSTDDTITLRWADSSYLSERCDAIVMIDTTGQLGIIDMLAQDSLTIVSATSRRINSLLIVKHGAYSVDGVKEDKRPIPRETMLEQNYPNPFNPSTTVSFVIGHRSFVTLKVYDLLGREAATLVNEEKGPGLYHVALDAVSGGRELSSGVYFYRLQAGGLAETRKMVVVR